MRPRGLDREALSRDDAPMTRPVAGRAGGRGALLRLLALLSIATSQGCGSGAASQGDGATGVDAAVDRADGAAPVFDCPELPCLGTAVSVIAPCKPDNTCTYQMATMSETRCFTNGVTIMQTTLGGTTSNPGGQVVMSVKKDGAVCYAVEITYADAARSAASSVYRDGSGTPLVTLAVDSGSNNTGTVTCPGGAAAPAPTTGSCADALNSLGGFIPFFSCLSRTEGACVF